jgi:hypothetical protein
VTRHERARDGIERVEQRVLVRVAQPRVERAGERPRESRPSPAPRIGSV